MVKKIEIETKFDWRATLAKFEVGDKASWLESYVNMESLRNAASYQKANYNREFTVSKYVENGTGVAMVAVERLK